MNSSLARKLAVALLAIAIVLLPAASWAAGEGADLFKGKCAMCHGPDGSGDTAIGKKNNVRDLRGAEVQKHTDAQLTEIITKGKPPKMPEYGSKLSADQIKQLVSHLRSIKK